MWEGVFQGLYMGVLGVLQMWKRENEREKFIVIEEVHEKMCERGIKGVLQASYKVLHRGLTGVLQA